MEQIAICDGEAEGFAKVLTCKGSGKIIGAAIVHMHAGELLAELTIARKYGVPLSKFVSTMHVYPTLSKMHRSLGDAYLLQRTTPKVRGKLRAWCGRCSSCQRCRRRSRSS
jgi:Pyridine nucleotide-disulphide oxidoreductase, dimerisation domain